MKTLFLTILALTFSVSAHAASTKICFGTGEHKGDHFVVEFTTKAIRISNSTIDWLKGTFDREGTVDGRDGKTYIRYDLGTNDGENMLLAEQSLLKDGTKGWVKVRNRGEGFSQDSYFCKDAK